ncbi:hypothetical protein PHK61_25400 [Actinomycetospora lutea]|uniref:hypothetical protein n=1 Tax=Actinomycetospora lutea TaxID=663604 RepID=UPI002366ED10|nr:hypothetical protein [Actinomycetospora lutea]MDD7941759.1 hypothetical protein [Actinomycetospora lutea]
MDARGETGAGRLVLVTVLATNDPLGALLGAVLALAVASMLTVLAVITLVRSRAGSRRRAGGATDPGVHHHDHGGWSDSGSSSIDSRSSSDSGSSSSSSSD